MTDMAWLSQEARNIHQIFSQFFYLFMTLLLLLGVVMEYFKLPIGESPSFTQLVGRVFIAALLLHAYPDITNAIADLTDAMASRLGDLNQIKLVLDRMSDKLGELSWSWVSVKDTVMLIISFLTFFILYFSIHVADAFYLYTWTLLFVFSPLLIALFVLPITAGATKALFRSLIEVSCWKIVWSVIATLLWSSALSQINQTGTQVSFLSAICFNIILAGSLLLTPFVVHALAGSGLAAMTRSVGAVAIGGLAFTPGTAMNAAKTIGTKSIDAGKSGARFAKEKFQATRGVQANRTYPPKKKKTIVANKNKPNQES